MLLGVDVGGTFTDAVLLEDGRVRTAKVPTARRQEESVLAAAGAVGALDGGRVDPGRLRIPCLLLGPGVDVLVLGVQMGGWPRCHPVPLGLVAALPVLPAARGHPAAVQQHDRGAHVPSFPDARGW